MFKATKSLFNFATLALVEHNGKVLSKNTLKLITAAHKLKDQTHLLVCGETTPELLTNINQFAGNGITKVIAAPTKHLLAEQIASIIKNIVSQGGYKNVVGISSSLGKDVIPRVAGSHATQPITDITQICAQNTYLRPTYAGNAITKITTSHTLNFLTFRPSSFEEAAVAQGSPQVVNTEVASDVKTSFVKEESSDSSRPDLTTARIVVSGGRGIKSKQNFKIISDLASAFGDAAIGASRAAVDAGYCPNELQVGQTGKVVAPQLYLAVGISGAVQHLAGMKDSKVIVAINTKSDEPIFEVANYGLQADLFKVVPELTEKLKAIRGQ